MNIILSDDPRYHCLDIELAKFIIDQFCRECDGHDFEAIEAMPEGAIAVELYTLALGWLVNEDRWQEAGLDPEFVKMVHDAQLGRAR